MNEFELYLLITRSFLEPVGSVAPKFISGHDIKVITHPLGEPVTFLCPAQAFPKAIFR